MQRRGGGHGLGAVLFTDIVGSTAIAAEMGNTRWSELVARHHRIVRRELDRFGGREMDTAGDGFFATFERPADAIRCAVAATGAVRELGIEIRAGVSFGELESVGKKASGLVVNTAARVMSVAGPGEVLVPASVREIVTGGGISFAEHGVHQLKGLDGEFRLFKVDEVDGAQPAPPLDPEEAADRRREIFPTGSSRRRAMLIGVGAAVVALILAGVLLATGGEPGERVEAGPPQDSVALFDVEQGRVGQRILLGRGVQEDTNQFIDRPIAAGEGGVWVIRPPQLIRVDTLHGEVHSTRLDIAYSNSSAVDTGFDSAWVLSGKTMFKVHPATNEGTPFVDLPPSRGIVTWSSTLSDDSVWIAESDGTLVRVDPNTGSSHEEETGISIDLIAATRASLWTSDAITGDVNEVDPGSLRPVGDPLRPGEGGDRRLAGRGDALWILDRQLGAVTRINADSRVISPPARVGDDPTGIAVSGDAVWVADAGGWLYRVDPGTLGVERFRIGFVVRGVAVDPADDAVWLYLGRPIAA
jgi:class 3 adenylate cyclase/streptogramin lyase